MLETFTKRLWLLTLFTLMSATGALAQSVAKVGDTEYATIEDAIAAWGSGKTLTLLSDVQLSEPIIVTEKVVLDLSTFTLSAPSGNNHAIIVRGSGSANLTVNADATNPGHIKSNATTATQFFGCTSACIYADYTDCAAKKTITINGGVFDGACLFNQKKSGEKGTPLSVTINGGVFNAAINAYRCYYLTINGGTFNTFYGYNGAYQTSTCKSYYYGGRYPRVVSTSSGASRAYYYGSVDIQSATNTDFYYIDEEGYYCLTKGKSYLPTSYQALGNGYRCLDANVAISKFTKIVLSEGVTATQDQSISSGTLTIDATATGSAYTGNITLTGQNAKFIIQYPEGNGHYGVTTTTGQLHVEESVADGVVTRTYSVLTTITNPEAKVGDTNYSTVYDAFYAIDGRTDNPTIVLQRDATNATIITNGTAVNAAGKTVATFDLNGHSIGISSVGIGNNADYTLTIIDSSEEKTGVVTNTTASLFLIALTGINDYSGSYTLKVQAGKWQFDPSNVEINGEVHNMVDKGYEAVNNGDGTWTVNPANFTVTGFEDENGNKVTASAATAAYGSEVVLTIATAEGYTLKSLNATGGAMLKDVVGNATQRSFIMPADDVKISAVFEKTATIDETTASVEEATVVDEENATITSVEAASMEGTVVVTVSATVKDSEDNDVPVTEIAEGAFASLAESNVAVVDLSNTQIDLGETSRSESLVLKDIPETALVYLPSTSSAVTGTNVVISDENDNYTCVNFEAQDRKACIVPKEFTANNATFKRTFTPNTASTICIPYSVPAKDIQGTVYSYTGISEDGTAIIMTQSVDQLQANVPYIIMPTEEDAEITAQNINVKIEDHSTLKGNYTFKGVFETKKFTDEEIANGVYGYAAKAADGVSVGQFVKGSKGASVPAMRAYLEYTGSAGAPSFNGAKVAANRPSSLKVILKAADGETTDILSLDLETTEDGTPVYTLSGQRATKGTKGILIKNGKKVLVK